MSKERFPQNTFSFASGFDDAFELSLTTRVDSSSATGSALAFFSAVSSVGSASRLRFLLTEEAAGASSAAFLAAASAATFFSSASARAFLAFFHAFFKSLLSLSAFQVFLAFLAALVRAL